MPLLGHGRHQVNKKNHTYTIKTFEQNAAYSDDEDEDDDDDVEVEDEDDGDDDDAWW